MAYSASVARVNLLSPFCIAFLYMCPDSNIILFLSKLILTNTCVVVCKLHIQLKRNCSACMHWWSCHTKFSAYYSTEVCLDRGYWTFSFP